MTKTLWVQFDGKVFVPQVPVNLPINHMLEITIVDAPRPSDDRPAGEMLKRWIADQPAVDRGNMPTDAAAQHDHYLYGHPKRP